MSSRRLLSLLATLAVLPLTASGVREEARPPEAADPCAGEDRSGAPDPHLYCVDLVPAAAAPGAKGTVELRRAVSPFGVAVTRDGHHRYDLVFRLEGLPPPASLGGYRTFVAWATTPQLDPVLRLGEVRNGRVAAGHVALNKFLILVSAEASPEGATRRGPLVLRGMSPSSLLLPHGTSLLPPRPSGGEHAHPAEVGGWSPPPMHPAVPTMVAGLEALEPSVSPWLPGGEVDPAGIPEARPHEAVDLRDGDTLRLEAGLVRRRIGGRELVMYGFNRQYPGPLVRVAQGATVVVDFVNRLGRPSAVHWHGIRLENRFDGVPGLTQEAVPPGGRFTYRVHFPDAGIYWYHPHLREDAQQDLGLYGNLLVRSPRPDYFGPANREEVLMLDDLLLGPAGLLPYGREAATHALMGRMGNVHLVNGEPAYALRVRRGEVVRFHLTNASNARVYNLALEGARMKVVGADVGKFEREEWVESVVIAPAERYVVEARFGRPGRVALTNRVQAINHPAGAFFPEVDTLGTVEVLEAPARPDHGAAFARLRRNAEVTEDLAGYRRAAAEAPRLALDLTLRVQRLPFPLLQVLRLDTAYVNPVEWSATMPMMDWLASGREAEWVLRDPATGRENMAIGWRFRRGEVVRLRLTNDRHTLHPMQHPMHLHGQRFLVLAQNDVPNVNLVWKDTVLLPVGATVDLLVELANPGRWMLHCHIAEHLEAGMHTVIEVTDG